LEAGSVAAAARVAVLASAWLLAALFAVLDAVFAVLDAVFAVLDAVFAVLDAVFAVLDAAESLRAAADLCGSWRAARAADSAAALEGTLAAPLALASKPA
jgi:hypothetical protein